MKNDLPLLQSTTLFSGLSAEELQALLTRLGAVVRSFGRGEVLVLAGAPSHSGEGRILQKITPGKSVRHDTFLRLSTKYGVRVSPKQGPQYPGR